MARFEWVQPEYQEWAREIATDPADAEAALLRLRERMQRDGDAEDQYAAEIQLLTHPDDRGAPCFHWGAPQA